MHTLENELKTLILRESDKQDLDLPDWHADEPLFGDASRIGLDSLDALQISVAVHARYGVRLHGDSMVRKHMHSLAALAACIRSHSHSQP